MSDRSEEQKQRVQAAINLLIEHFDTVQIFVTKHEPISEQGTVSIAIGDGNWHARAGQVSDWLVKQEERTRQAVRREG